MSDMALATLGLVGIDIKFDFTIFVGVDSVIRVFRALHRPSSVFYVLFQADEAAKRANVEKWVNDYRTDETQAHYLPKINTPSPVIPASGKRVLLSGFKRGNNGRLGQKVVERAGLHSPTC
jgi:hypothetical protein